MIASTFFEASDRGLARTDMPRRRPGWPAAEVRGPFDPGSSSAEGARTPPATKLPRFLVAATAALFEDGIADPRGCEYREVEIGDRAISKIRGFVLPRAKARPIGSSSVGTA